MKLDEHAHQLPDQRYRFVLGQRAALEPSRERLAVEQLHDEEGVAFVFGDFIELAGIGMRQRGGRSRLVEKTIATLRIVEILTDQLDRNPSV